MSEYIFSYESNFLSYPDFFLKEESFTWPFCVIFFVLKKAVSQAEGWDAFRTAWISVLSCPQPTKIQKGWQGIWMARKIRAKDHCRINSFGSRSSTSQELTGLPSWCLSQRVKGLSIYGNWNESNVDKDWLESHTRNSTNDVLFGLCFFLPKKLNFCWNFGVT